MKILHTSDWHLGKRLPPFSREDEQRQVLKEIAEIARLKAVDVTLIAGDVFDTSVPPASAEEMFYTAALELARTSLVVAVAGNHDDGERLKAPDALAKAGGILLAGGFDCSGLGRADVEAKKGGIIYRKNGERLNLGLLPYITESRRGDAPAVDFSAYVKDIIDEISNEVFSSDGCNVFMSHLFLLGGCKGTEERELGAAKLLPPSVLPEADYIALGHIHKPMRVKDNAFYSGSVLNYSFDETTDKEVIIFDTVTHALQHVPLKSGRKLLTVKAGSFEDALAAVGSAGDAYVKLVYDGRVPLSASQTSCLERAGNLAQLEIVPCVERREITRRAHRSAEQLFKEYYGSLYGGEKPEEELTAEFLSVLGEDE